MKIYFHSIKIILYLIMHIFVISPFFFYDIKIYFHSVKIKIQTQSIQLNYGNKKWKDDKMSFHFQYRPPELFCKKCVLENFANFTGKHLCWSLFSIKFHAFRSATLLKETPTQVFSCEICETFKNIYFEKPLRTTALHF